MEPARGHIFYVDWEEDAAGVAQKERPSLIVQNDAGNKFSPYVIVAAIHHETEKRLPVTVSVPKGAANLSKDSIVDCGLIYTIPRTSLGKFVGKLSDPYMAQVNKALKKSFALT